MDKAKVGDTKMPRTDTPGMEVIKFAVPAALLEEAIAMAAAEGWKEAEFHRILWERGFANYAEGSNKRLVNKKLRRNLEDMDS